MNTTKNSYRINVIEGENPVAILSENNKITYVIEENKVSPVKKTYPECAIDLLRTLTQEPDIDIEMTSIPLDKLPNPYFGLGYSNESVYGIIRAERLFYKQYIHKPENPKFATPAKFFEDIAELVKKGLRVGWFVGRWGIGTELDLNRCILVKRMMPAFKINGLDKNPLFSRLIDTIRSTPHVEDLNAYHPNQAIEVLKKKEIDVLVIQNLIVANKESDLNGNNKH